MMLLIGIDIKVDVVIIAEANYDLFNAYPNVHIGIKKCHFSRMTVGLTRYIFDEM